MSPCPSTLVISANRHCTNCISRDYVVDSQSAGPQLPGVTYYSIEATHSTMCKFETADSPGYSNVSSAIRQWVQEAPDSIHTRWTLEDEEKNTRAISALNQMAKQLVCYSPIPYLYVYRANL